MATITKRTAKDGSTSYKVEVRLKGTPAQRVTFERLTDARRWAQQTEAAIREGRHFGTVEAKRHTLAELNDRYTRDVLPAKKESTVRAQRFQFDWWRSEYGHLTLADLTPAVLAEARDKLLATPSKRGEMLSPAYVVRHLAALSHAFSVAVKEWGWLEDNPLRKVKKPKEPRGRVRFLSDEERERLLQACRESASPDLYPAVVLALSTGARQQEILGLRWPQVDLTRKVAILHDTKNGERRVLPLSGAALDLLRERSKVRRLDSELVFPGRTRNPKPVDLRTPFETALKRAGIEDFRWHDLRHTAASYLAMGGASLAEIAEILGHKTLAMVKRYAHLSDSHVAGVVERMNAKFLGDA
ncbi:MAG: site-specific integrase [Chromatiaceae bacterium]|jgi:integrase